MYGSSAGAINATYFLSGQRDGVGIYTQHIANQRFIDLGRLWKRGQGARAQGVTAMLDACSPCASVACASVLRADIAL